MIIKHFRLLTHPCLVEVLHDLDAGDLAVLCPGHSQEAEGHSVVQHSVSEEGKRQKPRKKEIGRGGEFERKGIAGSRDRGDRRVSHIARSSSKVEGNTFHCLCYKLIVHF